MTIESHIADLKKVKVPLWARWRGYFAARRRRKEAAKEIKYIATVYGWTIWTDKSVSSQWYILKEDGLGRRFYEYGYETSFLEYKEKKHSTYPHVIVPWLHKHYSNATMVEYAKKSAVHPNQRQNT